MFSSLEVDIRPGVGLGMFEIGESVCAAPLKQPLIIFIVRLVTLECAQLSPHYAARLPTSGCEIRP